MTFKRICRHRFSNIIYKIFIIYSIFGCISISVSHPVFAQNESGQVHKVVIQQDIRYDFKLLENLLIEHKTDSALKVADYLAYNCLSNANYRCLESTGELFFQNKMYLTANVFFYTALKAYKEKKTDQRYIIKILIRIADSYNKIGLYKKSLNILNSIQQLKKHKTKDSIKSQVFISLARTYQKLNESDSAHLYYDMAFQLTNNKVQVANLYLENSTVYIDQKLYNKAFRLATSARNLFDSLNNKTGISKSDQTIGHIYYQNQSYEKALKYYQQALETLITSKPDERYQEILLNISRLYYKKTQYDSSLYYLDSMSLISTAENLPEKIMLQYLSLKYKINKGKNNFTQYTKYLERYSYFRDSCEMSDKRIYQKDLSFFFNNRFLKSSTEGIPFNEQTLWQKEKIPVTYLYIVLVILLIIISGCCLIAKSFFYRKALFSFAKNNIGVLRYSEKKTKFLTKNTYRFLGISAEQRKNIDIKNFIDESYYDEFKKSVESQYDKSDIITLENRPEQWNFYFYHINLFLKKYTYIFFYPLNSESWIEQYQKELKGLKNQNQIKNRMFSLIGHDLRNAVGNSKSVLEIISEDINAYGENSVGDILMMLKKATTKAYDMLENILYWSRIQRQEMKFQPEQYILNEIVEDVISKYQQSAKDKNIQLLLFPSDPIQCHCDEHMITVMLRNILSNALKYTDPNGEIQVSITQNSKMIEIMVRDTGIGVGQEDIEKIFSPEELYSTYSTDGEKGLGIGLYLSKALIDKHKGKIEFESQKGEGTIVRILLPVS